jgi:hypothetical protein
MLLTIAENLLKEPDNPKFQKFKPTNSIIKKNLVDPKGTIEYAVEVCYEIHATYDAIVFIVSGYAL